MRGNSGYDMGKRETTVFHPELGEKRGRKGCFHGNDLSFQWLLGLPQGLSSSPEMPGMLEILGGTLLPWEASDSERVLWLDSDPQLSALIHSEGGPIWEQLAQLAKRS